MKRGNKRRQPQTELRLHRVRPEKKEKIRHGLKLLPRHTSWHRSVQKGAGAFFPDALAALVADFGDEIRGIIVEEGSGQHCTFVTQVEVGDSFLVDVTNGNVSCSATGRHLRQVPGLACRGYGNVILFGFGNSRLVKAQESTVVVRDTRIDGRVLWQHEFAQSVAAVCSVGPLHLVIGLNPPGGVHLVTFPTADEEAPDSAAVDLREVPRPPSDVTRRSPAMLERGFKVGAISDHEALILPWAHILNVATGQLVAADPRAASPTATTITSHTLIGGCASSHIPWCWLVDKESSVLFDCTMKLPDRKFPMANPLAWHPDGDLVAIESHESRRHGTCEDRPWLSVWDQSREIFRFLLDDRDPTVVFLDKERLLVLDCGNLRVVNFMVRKFTTVMLQNRSGGTVVHGIIRRGTRLHFQFLHSWFVVE